MDKRKASQQANQDFEGIKMSNVTANQIKVVADTMYGRGLYRGCRREDEELMKQLALVFSADAHKAFCEAQAEDEGKKQ